MKVERGTLCVCKNMFVVYISFTVKLSMEIFNVSDEHNTVKYAARTVKY